jgi:large subunit ribosomal protein L32
MAVQKSRVTRSRRGMRRAHDGLTKPTLATDSETGETHRRHHVSPDGYYKGRQVIKNKIDVTEDESNEA